MIYIGPHRRFGTCLRFRPASNDRTGPSANSDSAPVLLRTRWLAWPIKRLALVLILLQTAALMPVTPARADNFWLRPYPVSSPCEQADQQITCRFGLEVGIDRSLLTDWFGGDPDVYVFYLRAWVG